jgi:hypothetical protein
LQTAKGQITSLKFDNNAILNETRILFQVENIVITKSCFDENGEKLNDE